MKSITALLVPVVSILFILVIPNVKLVFEIGRKYGKRRLIRDICDDAENKDIVFTVKKKRALSISFGDGTCEYTGGEDFPADKEASGVLITSYPASGMRLTWQHVEGLTALIVGDDFDCQDADVERKGIIKTQYPHLEGIWSWADNMRDVVLLVRNPRWAIPSYHTLISEIHYAHDCETAYLYMDNLFTARPNEEYWIKWRDLRFEEEMDLWRWHIDFWMSNGQKYWTDFDYERNGQFPFAWVAEEDRTQDVNCIYQNIDCAPKVVVAYEYIRDLVLGPDEINKIAMLLENREGIEVIESSARECIFHATLANKTDPHNDGRPGFSEVFQFTYEQYGALRDLVQGMKDKYGSEPWLDSSTAQDLVKYFSLYVDDIEEEMEEIVESNNYAPTTPPNIAPSRHLELQEWYKGIGRGNRYDKAKVQALFGYWPKVAHLYEGDETEND